MPNYQYKNKDTGETKVIWMSVDEMWDKTEGEGLEIEGVFWDRDIAGEHTGTPSGGVGWPLASEAAGTHPDEVPKAMAEMRSKGVNLNYTKDGRAIFENASQRRKALRALGMQDMNGYD
mgnify:CR=1 FL=1